MKCFICGTAVEVGWHHIHPRDEGGSDDERNKIPLCETHHNKYEWSNWGVIYEARIRARKGWRNYEPKSDPPAVHLLPGYHLTWREGEWYVWWKEPGILSFWPVSDYLYGILYSHMLNLRDRVMGPFSDKKGQ